MWIASYERTIGNEKPVQIDPEDIIHFRFGYDPHNQRLGFSPLLTGESEVSVLNEGAAYRADLMSRHGVPSYAMTPQNDAVAKAMDETKVTDLNRL